MGAAKLKPFEQSWQGQLIRFAPYVVGGIILIIVPLFLGPFHQSMMTRFLIFALFAMSLNLLWGYTGLRSLGHAAFFGVGGYTAGILITRYGMQSFWLVAPVGILMAVLVAAGFGFIALRTSGIFFLMVTFALGQLMATVARYWVHVTGGAYGLSGISRLELGIPGFIWTTTSLYYFTFLIFATCYFLLHRIVKSPFGYVLQGIREDEPRMRALGYNIWLYKYIAFIVAGTFAGIAGVLLVQWKIFISPIHVSVVTSTIAVLYVIIGGAGTLAGPVIGAAIVIGIEYAAAIHVPGRWPLILGALFVIVVMFLRGGLFPHLVNLWNKVRSMHSYGSVKG